jgi:hypothetical protein
MLLFCVFRGARLDAVMIYKFFFSRFGCWISEAAETEIGVGASLGCRGLYSRVLGLRRSGFVSRWNWISCLELWTRGVIGFDYLLIGAFWGVNEWFVRSTPSVVTIKQSSESKTGFSRK